MSLLCNNCSLVLPAGRSRCQCGRDAFYCGDCRNFVPYGETSCLYCSAALVRSGGAELGTIDLPDPAALAVPVVLSLVTTREAGQHGVSAVVTMPPQDVDALNDLARLVPVLHLVASKVARLPATDHSRKLSRDMRVLAADAQEEVESRRGPL